MPDPTLTQILLSKLGFNLPPTPEPLTPDQQALQDEVAKRAQAKLSPAQRYMGKGVDQAMEAFKGITGLGDQGPAGRTTTNAFATLGAALPLVGGLKGIPGTYSRLTRSMEELPSMVAPNRALSVAKNMASGEEIATRGLPGFLADQRAPKISREDILNHLKDNPLDVEVSRLGGPEHPLSRAPVRDVLEQPEFRDWYYKRYDQHLAPNASEHPETYKTSVGIWKAEKMQDMNYRPAQYADRKDLRQPGGTNYTETLIKLKGPKPLEIDPQEFSTWYQKKYGYNPNESVLADVMSERPEDYGNIAEEYRRMKMQQMQQPYNAQYTGGHFSDPDIMAHTRHTDRRLAVPESAMDRFTQDKPTGSGELGQFNEESQSDLHQAGKEFGYQDPDRQRQIDKLSADHMAMYQDLQEALAGSPVTGGDHPADYLGNVSWTARQRGYDYAMQEYGLNTPGNEDLRDMVKKYLANEHQLNQLDMDHNSMDAVPDKPFKESWPDLVTKQHIMDVVNDPEKSWYGWTTGDQQVKRYGTQQLTWEKHPTEEGWNVRFQPQVGGRGQGIPDIGEEAIRRGLINNVSGHIKTREGLGALLYDQGGHKVSADKAWKRIQASPEFGVYQPRAEGMKSYYDVQEAGRVNRILKPFSEAKGVEKAPIEAPPTNKNQIYAGGNFGQIVEVPHDQEFNPLGVTANDPRQVASVWPKLAGTEGNNTLRNERRLVDLLKRQQDHPIFGQKNTNSFESWITRISPELKAQIKEKGLPLLTSLYMIWQHQQGQNAQTPPSTQPEQ